RSPRAACAGSRSCGPARRWAGSARDEPSDRLPGTQGRSPGRSRAHLHHRFAPCGAVLQKPGLSEADLEVSDQAALPDAALESVRVVLAEAVLALRHRVAIAAPPEVQAGQAGAVHAPMRVHRGLVVLLAAADLRARLLRSGARG